MRSYLYATIVSLLLFHMVNSSASVIVRSAVEDDLQSAADNNAGRTRRQLSACSDIAPASQCEFWFNYGHCSNQPVSNMCKKTCGMCQGSPIDGGYSQWGPWSVCSRTCAGGIQQRSRLCTNPAPENGGRDCSRLGPETESIRCNTQSCPACTNIAADRQCRHWFNNGHCSNPTVSRACKRTCGTCQVAACTNLSRDSLCQQWSNGGFCSDPTVRKMCKRTCHFC